MLLWEPGGSHLVICTTCMMYLAHLASYPTPTLFLVVGDLLISCEGYTDLYDRIENARHDENLCSLSPFLSVILCLDKDEFPFFPFLIPLSSTLPFALATQISRVSKLSLQIRHICTSAVALDRYFSVAYQH